MTTEHVSVPRDVHTKEEVAAMIGEVMKFDANRRLPNGASTLGMLHAYAAILSRATPSDEVGSVSHEMLDANACSPTLNKPSAPRVVTADGLDVAIKSLSAPVTADELKRAWNMIGQSNPQKEWVERALIEFMEMRLAALESFATSLPAATGTDGWVKVKPRVEGFYLVRGFSLDNKLTKAVVEVRRIDGELRSNLHATNSDDDPNDWLAIKDHSDRMQWQLLAAAPKAGETK